ncbi:MAG TPA: flagellar hook capping FlgD N-terminal domain-containing protein [Spirochaetia bacterium]|nr:flagellar hook capping FlgD N-terminal domain-containing protein [Spirochaetia bacterium]
MSVSSVDNNPYQAPASSSSSAIGTTGMNETDFLDLLVAQLKNQDPDSPQDPSQFAAQLAQFSTVEELQNLNQNVTAFNQASELGEAAALIGKTVTVDMGNNQTDSGAVASVLYNAGNDPQVVVNGNSYGFSAIQEVD